MTWYKDGVVNLTNGSKTVTGVGTAWEDYALLSGIFFAPGNTMYEVESVATDTSLQLATPYAGPTVAGITYAIAPTQGYLPALAKKLGEFLAKLGPLKDEWVGGTLLDEAVKVLDLSTPATVPLGGFSAGDAQGILDNALPMGSYATLRNYTGRAQGVRITARNIGGYFQRISGDTSADNGGTVIVDASGRRWLRIFDGRLNVKWFGALGDGVALETVAVQAAINALMAIMANPPGVSTNRGVGQLYFPRGKYLLGELVVGLQVGTRPFGFMVEGDGEYGTSLVFSANAGSFWKFKSYNSITFQNLAIIHPDVVNIQTNRDNWTNICFDMDGTGGGRHFVLRNVTTHGFDKLISLVKNAGNQDTNFFEDCTLLDGNTLMYCRNNEAVVNSIRNCTIGTEWRRFMDVAGFGHTTVQNCNIVIAGTVLYLPEFSQYDSRQNSRYVFDNCKLELYAPYGAASGATTKLIETPVDTISAAVFFRNCTMAGGKNPDASVFQIDLLSALTSVFFEGCFLRNDMKMRVGTSSGMVSGLNVIRFEDCDSTPLPANITLVAQGGGQTRCPIVYKNCAGVSDVAIIDGATDTHEARFFKSLSLRAGGYLVLGAATVTMDYPLYNRATQVKGITAYFTSKTATAAGSTINVYSDAGRTVLFASFAIPTAANVNPATYEFALPASAIVREGLYFTLTQTQAGAGITGKIGIDYVNF